MSDDKVTPLPVKFKAPPDDSGPMLKVVTFGGCNHRFTFQETGGLAGTIVNASYHIREGETEVECSLCNTKLDPMFVLRILASEETKWMTTRKRYQEEMQRLKERERTTCQHCGKMTRISRK